MLTFKLVLRHALGKKLRLVLTLVGIVAAVAAFGLLQTIISAWDRGTSVYSARRVITHHGASLAIPIPLSMREKIRRIEGVEALTSIYWFNGIYLDQKNFFPKFAVDAASFLDVYPELRVTEDARRRFLADPTGCLIGERLAERFKLRTGDTLTIVGAKYRGAWRFKVSGVYRAPVLQQEWQMLFHWEYINTMVQARSPDLANRVGAYISLVRDPAQVGSVASQIDDSFANSPNMTRSESENAFQLGWFHATEAIFGILSGFSFLVIAIILLLMANIMLMSVRERMREYATLKALGFGPFFLSGIVLGESVLIAFAGGCLGVMLTPLLALLFESAAGGLLPYLQVDIDTAMTQLLAALIAGGLAGLAPAWFVCRQPVTKSLRGLL